MDSNKKEQNKKQQEENKYIPLKVLGEGSFGTAYLVKSTSDDVIYFLF